MTRTITIHSFRGGTGKSTITSNLAVQLTQLGHSVLVMDLDISSPGIHAQFGLDNDSFDTTFNDVIQANVDIHEAVYDVSEIIGVSDGSLLLVPSLATYQDLAKALVESHNHKKLLSSIKELTKTYRPDYVLLDTHPGINEEVILSLDKTDALMIVVRPDNQDYQGVQVSLDIAKKLSVSSFIVLNKVHKKSKKGLSDQVEEVFDVPVIGTIPFSEDILTAESRYVFSAVHKKHVFSKEVKKIAQEIKKQI